MLIMSSTFRCTEHIWNYVIFRLEIIWGFNTLQKGSMYVANGKKRKRMWDKIRFWLCVLQGSNNVPDTYRGTKGVRLHSGLINKVESIWVCLSHGAVQCTADNLRVHKSNKINLSNEVLTGWNPWVQSIFGRWRGTANIWDYSSVPHKKEPT